MNCQQDSVHPTAFIGHGVRFEENAIVGPNCFIDGDIYIGRGAHVMGGVILIGNFTIESGAVIEPGVSFAGAVENRQAQNKVVIGENAYVGAGSVIAAGIKIGSGARVVAGTMVSKDVPANAIVSGNPASIIGYLQAGSHHSLPPQQGTSSAAHDLEPGVSACTVPGVTVHRFQRIRDLRGDLSVGEFNRNIPFQPKRYFVVFDVPSAETRGEHAHLVCQQFLICVSGSVSIVVDDGQRREEIVLDRPNLGLYIPPKIWGIQYKYTKGAVLLVFASDYYDASDYIRDYDAFLEMKKEPV